MKNNYKESFEQMDTNRDNVISRNEFSSSKEVSKLSPQYQKELFDEIDLNKDGVIQYNEFRTQAQVTESEVLNIQKEDAYLQVYAIAMEDQIITSDERKMLEAQAQILNITEERAIELEQIFNKKLEEE